MQESPALQEARAAYAERLWQEAFDLFRAVETEERLPPEDLDLFSDAAYWSGHVAEAFEPRQRSFLEYEHEGRNAEAATSAIVLALMYFGRGDMPLASGWLGTAQRLLAGAPESRGHALLAWLEGQFMARLKGFDQALVQAAKVEAIGRRLSDRDCIVLGISMQGFLRTATGDISGGAALLDEALAAVLAGELAPFTCAEVFCEMIVSCIDVADYERAANWLETAERAGRQLTSFPGCCRVHKAAVLRHRGEWAEAHREAHRGRDEVAGVEVLHEGMALSEMGELYRCRGELALAEHAFDQAYEKGWPPQPGLALLHLHSGDLDGAMRLIERAVEWSADEPGVLARLLPVQVQIAISNDDVAVIEAAATRLAEVASTLRSSTASAADACVKGLLLQRQGDLRGAARQLELTVRAWQQARSPYDTAQARMLLAAVLLELGDDRSASLEMNAAKRTFERLGAAPEAREAARRLGEDAPTHATRTFMFTDIVDSTSLLSVMGDDAWDGVRRWHDRTIAAIVGEHLGTVVKGTGDGFFVAFEDPDLAVDSAIAIQRAFDSHRSSEGFSPSLRIGLHLGSAISAGSDYAGQDVVVAARISALAAAEEILVSAAVAEHLSPHVRLLPRAPRELKGVPGKVDLAIVEWR